MDFQFTDEQTAIQETIRDFMAQECPRQVARDLDVRQVFPIELLRRIAALGFCGLNIPEEFGGGGDNVLGSVIAIEEIAALAPALASAFASAVLRSSRVITQLGSADQKKKFLPLMVEGKALFTYAMSEPGEGIAATPFQDGFILNGECKFVALGDQANYILVLAHHPERATCFIVDTQAQGLRVKKIPRVGFRGIHLCQLSFGDVRVSALDILGGEDCLNRGQDQMPLIKELQQIETAALCLGIAQGAYDYASQYARARVQFGKPLSQFEAVQHMLVQIAMDLRAVRLMLYQACSLADQGAPAALVSSMAHLYAVEMARGATLQCLHILGGYGYMMEYDAQRYVRDALALVEGSESTAILKNNLGAMLGLAESELAP